MDGWTRVQKHDQGGDSSVLEYMEVPGGRLYRTWVSYRNGGLSVALSFVPIEQDAPQPPADTEAKATTPYAHWADDKPRAVKVYHPVRYCECGCGGIIATGPQGCHGQGTVEP